MDKPEQVFITPVAREEISVQKRMRPLRRVRVRKRVVESHTPVELVSAREDVEVERVPVGKLVDVVPEVRVEGATTIVPVVEETVVVEKRILVREEIRITKRRTERIRRVDVPIKQEVVNVEEELAREELQKEKP